MEEFEIIRRWFASQTVDASVRVGIGDDGAVIRPAPDKDLVTVVDTIIGGVHFPAKLPPEDIGYRAVAVNLSDIAAMGAEPRWMTLALTLPQADEHWLSEFSSGLFAAASAFGVDLVGGDTTQGSDVSITVQITGEVDRGAALTRAGAMIGDDIYVTGTPGDAGAGLDLMQRSSSGDGHGGYLRARFARPQPRIEVGATLLHTATAAIDLSDGLYADLEKMMLASGRAARVDIDRLPLSRELEACLGREAALQAALSAGDDYELCFTVPAGHLSQAATIADVKVTRIGSVRDGSGIDLVQDGKVIDFEHAGYRHFCQEA